MRDFVAAHGKVLYDFADIRSYAPAGQRRQEVQPMGQTS